MDKLQQVRAFQATVESGIVGLQCLIGVLQQERDALLKTDAGALETAVLRKSEQLEMLSHSSAARDHLLQALGLPSGPEGAAQFLDRMKAPPAAREAWQRHYALACEAAQHNEQNARLAVQGERTTRKALAILTGRPLHEEDTYGPGKAGLTTAPRFSLAKA